MIALLCETLQHGQKRVVKEVGVPCLIPPLNRISLPGGRDVIVIPIKHWDSLYDIRITGFWTAGHVPKKIIDLAVRRAKIKTQRGK